MPTAPTAPTPFPGVPPSTLDPANFDPRMDATLGHLPTLQTEMAGLATNAFNNASDALSSANAAATSEGNASDFASAAAGNAAAAATSAGAAPWAAGNYNAGLPARSNINYRAYIARTTGSKPTDPALDPTNWRLASAGGLPDVPYSGTTVTVSLNERSRFTNAAAVAATVPVPTRAGEEWEGEWENGRVDNSFDIGAAYLRRNGVSLTSLITNSQRMIVRLISVGANEWRFA